MIVFTNDFLKDIKSLDVSDFNFVNNVAIETRMSKV
jgi:hypothetical protein